MLKVLRIVFGLLILLIVSFFLVITVHILLDKDAVSIAAGIFLLVILPFGNIGYSMVFKKPEEGGFSPFALYVYGVLVGCLGFFGAFMGKPIALWSLSFSAGCFQLANSKRTGKLANNKTL